jgi:hypothetical protein
MEGQRLTLAKGNDMANETPAEGPAGMVVTARPGEPEDERSSSRLISEAAREAVTLIKAEIALAKAEVKQDLKSEVTAAKGLGVAGVCALSTLNLLLVAAAIALGAIMQAWAGPLVVAAAVALVGAIFGLYGAKHVKVPLERTRKSLQEDVRWAKERIA